MTKIYIVTREPFHDNSTLLGAYPSIEAAELSVSPSPDKWSRSVSPGKTLVSEYLFAEDEEKDGYDGWEVHELVVIDDKIMAVVDGETSAPAPAPDERVLVLWFKEARFCAVDYCYDRETDPEVVRKRDCPGPEGPPYIRSYLMPDEVVQMRANESAPEVARALYALRAYAARQWPPIRNPVPRLEVT